MGRIQTYLNVERIGCIPRHMDEIQALLAERHSKAKAKVDRCIRALESAQAELSDVEAAIRVFADLHGEPDTAKPGPGGTMAERQKNILSILPDLRFHDGEAPMPLHAQYAAAFGDDVNLDTFRTTVWRMSEKVFVVDGRNWQVERVDGKYGKTLLLGDPVSDFSTIIG